MRPPLNPKPLPEPARDAERRRAGRIRTEEVTCSIGEVVDMSATGMRVRRKGKQAAQLGDRFTVTLKHGQFALPVDVRVVRLEKVGFRRYVFGLMFEELNPAIQAKLTALARVAAEQRVLV